jgi:hypothetical protein
VKDKFPHFVKGITQRSNMFAQLLAGLLWRLGEQMLTKLGVLDCCDECVASAVVQLAGDASPFFRNG